VRVRFDMGEAYRKHLSLWTMTCSSLYRLWVMSLRRLLLALLCLCLAWTIERMIAAWQDAR